MDSLKSVYDANALIDAFNKSKQGTDWKSSVQRYEANLLRNVRDTQKSLMDGTYKQKEFVEFDINERGKTRHIQSMHISDRVVQRSLCDNLLNPSLYKYLIYDNGASVKGKGTDFARKRLETHLHRYYRENGSNEGYILLMDYSKFFDNIPHAKLMEEISKKIKDTESIRFISGLIDTFRVDVSYMTEDEYAHCMGSLYNALEHAEIGKELLTGEKYMGKSVGIGSQISQVCGIFYPTRIDNYCKIVRGMKYYGRYMDDSYIIHRSKELLRELLGKIREICKDIGIFINEKKTHIVKLSRTFKFLKTRYFLSDTGKVVKRCNKDYATAERGRLKKFREKLDNGEMEYEEIAQQYSSWRGNLKHYASYHMLKNMDALYNRLFIEPFVERDDYFERKPRNDRTAGTAG